jgi:N6-L-threonylcarbamoyladenine synthase
VKLLAIETSCDETAAAVLEAAVRPSRSLRTSRSSLPSAVLLSDVVSSQIADHAPYGGVVPELASRKHLVAILPVIRRALAGADCTLDDIDALAVTSGPGLVGSLLIGIQAAKAIAHARNLPLLGVHHLAAHLLSRRHDSAPAVSLRRARRLRRTHRALRRARARAHRAALRDAGRRGG